ncbi:MAG: hypothetical protein WKG01_18695 [Kofleriaceae bacterium]
MLLTLSVACGPKAAPANLTRDDAIIVFKSNVKDAQLFVDGRHVASLEALRGGVAVEPGTHRFELRHEDYFSSYLELKLARAERKRLTVELAPVLP